MAEEILMIVGNSKYSLRNSKNAGEIEYFNDEENLIWKIYTEFDISVGDFEVVYLNKKLLIICGANINDTTNEVFIFDFKTLKKNKFPSAIKKREHFTANVIDENVFVCGGQFEEEYMDDVEIFNVTTNICCSTASMNTKRRSHASVVYEGTLYVFGGFNAVDEILDSAEYYDSAKYGWFNIAKMNIPLMEHAAAVVGDKIYLFGGKSTDIGISNLIHIYDPVKNVWLDSDVTLPYGIIGLSAATMNDKIYISGGRKSAIGKHGTVAVYEFNPVTNKLRLHSNHNQNRYNHSLLVVPRESASL